jgi:hypothetical protein
MAAESRLRVLGGSHLARHLQQIAPMTAGLAIRATMPSGSWNMP